MIEWLLGYGLGLVLMWAFIAWVKQGEREQSTAGSRLLFILFWPLTTVALLWEMAVMSIKRAADKQRKDGP